MRGAARGAARGSVRGSVRGAARGSVRGTARGAARGSVRGTARGAARGNVRGAARGAARGEVRGEVRGAARGKLQESRIEAIYEEFEDTLNLLPDRIEPIAPKSIGYTSKSQMNIYFYMDKPSSKLIEFTLNRKDELDPVIISYIDVNPETGIIDPGIHAISLEALNITLEESVEYEWFVTIVIDVVERSGDIVASGIIVHRDDSQIDAELAKQNLPEYGIYALNGYWYDAMDSIMSLKDKGKQTPLTNRQLVHWLSQEKLPSTCSFLNES